MNTPSPEAIESITQEQSFKDSHLHQSNEWFTNNLVGLAKSELTLATKNKRSVDRRMLLKWIIDNLPDTK